MTTTEARWPPPASTEAAALGMQKLEDSLAHQADGEQEAVLEWARAPEAAAMLAAAFGSSPHLTELIVRHIGHVRGWCANGPGWALDDALGALAPDGASGTAEEPGIEALMARLRTAKQRAALAIALADIGGVWTIEEITAALSRMADACLSAAVRALLRQADARGDLSLPDRSEPEKDCGYVILAMGKLGACELNYSSDIDLIVLYNQDKVRSARPERIAQTFQRITRDLVRIMEERTAQGYVFRTDLRLRPDPASTPIALSGAAAEIYYASLARTWERAAMIKARPCAGDLAEGERFLTEIRPFIWRTSLDFAVVEEFGTMRARVTSRAAKGMRQTGGFDVKLGSGGIRDIEFFVQTQQLVFGGREVALRTPKTLDALEQLAEARHIAPGSAEDLAGAYRFWRRVEHRLQMIDDRQTHLLPDGPEELGQAAAFLGYGDRAGLETDVAAVRELVELCTGDLFAGQRHKPGPAMSFEGLDVDPETLAQLEGLGFRDAEAAFATVNGWMRGRARATLTERGRTILAHLAPTLLERIGETGDPGATLMRWDRFIGGLPAGVQLFSLLAANTELIDLLTELLSAAPIIADQLTSRPEQLDALLLPGFLSALPAAPELADDLSAALSVSRHYEESLSIFRRWMNDQRLRAAVHLLRDPAANATTARFLSDAVETALAALLPLVADEFAIRHGRVEGAGLAILALGKLGSREMTIGSDLDLILVFDAPDREASSDGEKPLNAGVYFTRLTQRFINAITAPMKAGVLFELDMRLRPSGNAGPLATSLEGFVNYQRKDAWTWEHMALTRARPVAGDARLMARLAEETRAVLCKPREPTALAKDVREMRQRIAEQFAAASPWDVKYAEGGLIDISFAAQYLMLSAGAERPALVGPDMRAALSNLADAGLLSAEDKETLGAGYDLCLQIQAYLRLASATQIDVAKADHQVRRGLSRIVLGQRELGPRELGRQDGAGTHGAGTFDDATRVLETRLAACRAVYEALVAG